MDNKMIGNRINELLAKNNMLQKELAKQLDVSDNVISYWCCGSRKPSIEQIIQIAKLFNCSTDYLLGVSNVATSDKDMQYICDYLGLNEDTVNMLVEFKNYTIIPTDIDLGCYSSFLDVTGIKEIMNNSKNALDNFLSSDDFKKIITRLSMLITLTNALTNIENVLKNYDDISKMDMTNLGFNSETVENARMCIAKTVRNYKRETKYNIYSIIDILINYAKQFETNIKIHPNDIYCFFGDIDVLKKGDSNAE